MESQSPYFYGWVLLCILWLWQATNNAEEEAKEYTLLVYVVGAAVMAALSVAAVWAIVGLIEYVCVALLSA